MPPRPLIRSFHAVLAVGLVACGSGGGGGGGTPASGVAPNPALVAISPTGAPANGQNSFGFISSDGRWSAFTSVASNLVPGDDAGSMDIFVRDLDGTSITQVNRLTPVAPGDAGDRVPGMWFLGGISANGRYVAMGGVPETGSTPSASYRKDLLTGILLRIAVATGGAPADDWAIVQAMSEDGRVIAVRTASPGFSTYDTNGLDDVYVTVVSADGSAATNELISRRYDPAGDGYAGIDAANGSSGTDTIGVSGDGRYVVYSSTATNLVMADVSDQREVFRHDRDTNRTIRVAVATSVNGEGNGSSSSPAISRDGQRVAFLSTSSNLIAGDILPEPGGDGAPTRVYVRDIAAGVTRRLTTTGHSFRPTISADGRWIAFTSSASDLPHASGAEVLYLYDWNLGTLKRIDAGAAGFGDHYVQSPSLSADGTRVLFSSSSTNFVPGTHEGHDLFILTRAPSGAG